MANELSHFFRGYAKVELRHLEFQFSLFGKRVFDPSNFKILQEKFENYECAREEPQNFIAAVVSDDLLEQVITQSNTSPGILKDETKLPWLTFPDDIRLLCLYGKHRVEAARHALLPGDRWWSLALYSEDELRSQLCIHRDPQFSPGDIFRNWRHCELTGNADTTFWQSLISPRSRKDIKRLKENNAEIVRCLDQLIVFPGLWVDFCFTFIRRILQISCPKSHTI
ncbi:uncharacterized protein ATNIH1004_009166 [Aspergillus tanneri]|uniref:Uncharacterized protein n=1 Tax=Aspergillus tanneri TaxID=1220188 RepID=A0A5M9MD95_9EURO|nr:uncharacterized protein ATNIH1004_009166 [Aspergillus tanneri]KAA8644955.1 hypothetical protein ATNIH1004_009166 [Aspergillus tanneri]